MDRRTLLKTVAVAGTAAAVGWPAAAAQAYDRAVAVAGDYPVAPELLPFGHGVASGDPLADRVVLWTRVTIPDPRGWDATLVADPQGIRAVQVAWVLARDPALTDVVRRGAVTTTAARDWTVKVDADRLPSATTLYYAFTALGYRSPVGRTRTAPAPGDPVDALVVAHTSCTSWWQDLFNAYGRMADREDLDLVTHAGDHVYDSSGGHPASRLWAGQAQWETDLDNADFTTVAQCRRRYALYYADANLLRAHASAPFAVMPDQHDDDPADGFTTADAGTVFWEWTASRTPLPDGSGRFAPSPGPDVNVPVPTGDAARYYYRVLPYGDLADVVLLDVRRFASETTVLGDVQWAWLEGALRASRDRGAVHRYVVNQVNLSQLRAFNLPFAPQFEEVFGMSPNAPQGELYTTAWGGQPAERARLCRFLRAEGIVDNVVVSGDSHGFFGSDLVEDAQLPSYEPLTGGGLLGAVGVELVPSAMGRPGGQDVIAEELYFARTGGSRGAAFTDAATYDAVDRVAALPAVLALEAAARAANPNLQYFHWRAEYGYAVVQLRADAAVLEAWTTPQRVLSSDQRLLAQFRSPVGAPHLGAVLAPTPVAGTRTSALPPSLETVALPGAVPAAGPRAPGTPPAGPAAAGGSTGTRGGLAATGAGALPLLGAAAAVLGAVLARRSRPQD